MAEKISLDAHACMRRYLSCRGSAMYATDNHFYLFELMWYIAAAACF